MKIKIILLLGCLGFFACEQKRKQVLQNPSNIITEAVGIVNKDSNAAPIVTLLTAANAPKKVIAGKPEIIKNPFNDGLGVPIFTNYSVEQGLAINAVACSYQDKAGNIWFGTGAGVSRYDGKSFTNFNTANGLANNNVFCITEDKKGNIWFGTRDGASCYDGNSFTTFIKAKGMAQNDGVGCILEDKTGNLWFCTINGVSRYDGKSFTHFTTEQGLASNNVGSILEDKRGNLWFGTYDNGISRYDGKLFTHYNKAQGLPDNRINSIKQDRFGNIWFATEGGVSCYNGTTFTNFTTKQGLPNNDVMSIEEDRIGNLWFGSYGGGISRYDGNMFTYFTTEQGLANNTIMGVTKDRANNLWFSSDFGGLSRFDSKYFTNFTTSMGLVSTNIHSITEDKKGNIWLATLGYGVILYNGKSFINFTKAQGLPNDGVRSIIEDRVGNIWFGTSGGICRYDGKSITTFTTAQGLCHNRVYSILEDKAGNLWIGTYGGGISRYDGKVFTNFSIEQGLLDNHIWFIFEDKIGNLWFGSEGGGGLSCYDGKIFTNYTTAQGLADDVVYDIVEDTLNHTLWIGTNLGFSSLDLNQDLSVKNTKIKFKNYNYKTGYPIRDLNVGAMLLDNKGVLWGGCGDGKLIRFDYNALIKNTEPLSLHIQSISLNNENISWHYLSKTTQKKTISDSLTIKNEVVSTFGRALSAIELDSIHRKYGDVQFDGVSKFYPLPQNLRLPFQQNNISFEFVAIEPAMPKQVKYQYKLEGYDRDWSPLSNKTSANFGNINEGTYTFRVKALSPFDVWSETSYIFKVLPPWWRTWWAYLLYALVFASAIRAYIQYRSLKLKEENLQLEEKVHQRTNELEKSLTDLKSTQNQLIQKEKLASLGELTAGIAHEIQNPLNFVNNFSELSVDLAKDLNDEIHKPDIDKDYVEELLTDLTSNQEKINHHGKRASSIVKGMLEHSRASTGVKELTDINKLADEYLRLSYHGLRAKDKDFNADFKTDFDENLPKTEVIPQDIGRVLLNLINNAFYAVHQRKQQLCEGSKPSQSLSTYTPSVSVSTKQLDNAIEIRVKDNGTGMPEGVRAKVFQPFFTTKPTGQGTGLGLSLAYDIVTKGHGGSLEVESTEGVGTEFLIKLPRQ